MTAARNKRFTRFLWQSLLLVGSASGCRYGYELQDLANRGKSASSEELLPTNPTTNPDPTTDTGGAPPSETGSGGNGPGGEVGEAWWDDTFGRRVRVAVDNSSLSTTLIDFVVPVHLVEGAFNSALAGTNGEYLRFVAADHTTELPFELERNSTFAESTVWVKIPRIAPPPAATEFFIYYDNPAATPVESPADVWTNGFSGVWHLNDVLADSTGNSPDAISLGATPSPGPIQGAYETSEQPDNSASPINFASTSAFEQLFSGGGAISFWMRPRAGMNSSWPRILDKSTDLDSGDGWSFQIIETDQLFFEHDFSTQIGRWQSDGPAFVFDEWQSVTIQFDTATPSTVPSLFVNGVALSIVEVASAVGTPADDSGVPLYLGGLSGAGTRAYDGWFDEVRFSRVIRSADWIGMEHLCMSACTSIAPADEPLP